MELTVIRIDGSQVKFDFVGRITVRDGLCMIEGYEETEEGVMESREVLEPLRKIHSIEGVE